MLLQFQLFVHYFFHVQQTSSMPWLVSGFFLTKHFQCSSTDSTDPLTEKGLTAYCSSSPQTDPQHINPKYFITPTYLINNHLILSGWTGWYTRWPGQQSKKLDTFHLITWHWQWFHKLRILGYTCWSSGVGRLFDTIFTNVCTIHTFSKIQPSPHSTLTVEYLTQPEVVLV